MKYFNIKYLILLIVIPLAFSCSTKEVIYDTLTKDNSLNTQSDIVSFANAVYTGLNTDIFRAFSYPIWQRADDIYSTSAGFRGYGTKTDDATTANTINAWNGWFKNLNRANYLLDHIDATSADSAYKVRVKGEMYFLRAFCNFYLVRMWRNIPLKLHASALNANLFDTAQSVDQIYQQIFVDLQNANKVLLKRTAQPSAEFGRATKGAAQGFLAKAHLTYGNYLDLKGSGGASQQYQLAKDWCDSVISSGQYNLISSFKDLIDVTKEPAAYQEVLFGVQFTRDPVAQSLGSSFAANSTPGSMPNVGGNGTFKTGYGNFRVQPWFYQTYTSGDYVNDYRGQALMLTNWINTSNRKQVTFPYVRVGSEVITTESNPSSAPYLFRYTDPLAVEASSSENDYFTLRYADILLTKAEAENELNGPTTTAYTCFNQIRARARNADGITPRTTPLDLSGVTDKDSFRLKIADERAIEFLGEFARWFDLVRMKSPTGTTMMEYQLNVVIPRFPKGMPVYDATKRVWNGGRTDSASVPPFQSKFLIFPIPFSELSSNPNMSQNWEYK